jgi:hypothetical protein
VNFNRISHGLFHLARSLSDAFAFVYLTSLHATVPCSSVSHLSMAGKKLWDAIPPFNRLTSLYTHQKLRSSAKGIRITVVTISYPRSYRKNQQFIE